MVDVIDLDLIDNLLGVRQCFRDVCKDLRHFIGSLEPLLLGVVHAVDIVHVVVRAQADESVVCFGILFVDEVAVVGSDDLHIIFTREFNQNRVNLFLPLIHLHICAGFLRLMPLQFDVVVLAEQVLEPFHRLFRLAEIAIIGNSVQYLLRQFATEAGGTADDTFVPALQ